MVSRKVITGCTLSLLMLVHAGCSLGPDYQRPEMSLAESYREPSVSGESVANLPWWDVFKDPLLVNLVHTAIKENKDLQRAAARIDESRAILGITRADQFPTVDIAGNASRTNPSDVLRSGIGSPEGNFGLFGQLSYEIDFWGKLRRATEAQSAELLSSEYGYRAVTISLVSQVAQVYFRLLDTDQRLEITQRTVKNRKNATGIIRQRFNQGTVAEIDLNQAQIEEADVLARISSIEREQRQLENAMRVLLGTHSKPVPRSGFPKRELVIYQLPTGVPARILERRPDIASAEQLLHAETARIGVAEARRLPSVSLLGFIGLESEATSDFVSSDAKTWSIGGGLLGPLIDFNRSKSRVEVAEARTEQALKNYEQSVLLAIQEIEDSQVAIRTYNQEFEARTMQYKAAVNATRLSRARYNDGLTPYLEVLDVERSLLEAELAKSLSMQQMLVSVVQLYKALGGGWQPESN
jgi:multidrug efflux system outer membrane protein